MIEDPKRLSELELGDLGRALSAAKEQLPPAERLSRIAGNLARAGVSVPEASDTIRGPTHGPEPAAQALGPMAKAVIGVVGVGVVALGGALVSSRAEPDGVAGSAVSSAAATASASIARAPATPTAKAPSTPTPTVREAPPMPSPAATPSAAPAPTEPTDGAAPIAVPKDMPVAERESNAPAPSAVEARPNPRASSAGSAALLARDAPTRGSAGPGTAAVEAPPESEVELLKRARSTATSDPAQALAITARHRAEFPNGAYAQERDLIVITALLRLGRRGEANARAEAFRARYPRSAYLPQIERMLGAR